MAAALAADPTIRHRVVEAAHEVLGGDQAAPVARIALAAGVSRATLYRHFGSRAALLAAIAHEPRPDARTRILEAAEVMLSRTSLAELSMDDLAHAAGVSRGTLYRLVPGKAALLRGLVEAHSPFVAVRALVAEHAQEPPAVLLPLVARTVVGIAGRHLGLMRAMFHEATSGSPAALAGVRPVLEPALGGLAEYLGAQMSAGRVRRMHPLLALQAVAGPIYFHLMTRPVIEELFGLPMPVNEAIDELVAAMLAGLAPDR